MKADLCGKGSTLFSKGVTNLGGSNQTITQCNFLLETGFSNVGFRIAYFIWTLMGDNRLEPLEYYSDHLLGNTDDGVHLRGAYGPRISYWIGADQLQEAIDVNMDVSLKQDFVKPEGVNQLHRVYDDLNSGEMEVGTIIIRNPAIDFEDSEDIPDLVSVMFVVDKDSVNAFMNYESIDSGGNYVNDVWVFGHILEMYRSWLLKKDASLAVWSPICRNGITVDYVEAGKLQKYEEHNMRGLFHPNPNVFWKDLEILERFENHLRQRLKGEVFHNPDVAVAKITEELVEFLLDTMETQYLKEMGYALIIFALAKYGAMDGMEEFMMELFGKMESPLKYELAEHLGMKKGFSEPAENEIKSVIEYGRKAQTK